MQMEANLAPYPPFLGWK